MQTEKTILENEFHIYLIKEQICQVGNGTEKRGDLRAADANNMGTCHCREL
jgi:1,2-phenylacetyl-CoA epoxidase catalytic subunit